LTLITRDDRGDPALAVQHIRQLADQEHAVAILGPMGPAINASVLDWAAHAGVAVLAPFGGDVGTRVQDWKTAFFLTANQSAEAERLTNHVSALGWKRAAVIYTGDSAGRAALAAFEEALTISVINPVAVLELQPGGNDAAGVARAVSKSQAQVVFLATTGNATLSMLRALTAGKPDDVRLLQVYGLSSSASQVDLLRLGSQARGFSMSQVLPYPRDTRTALGATFNAAMRNLRDAPSDRSYTELEGCIAALVLADVIKRKPLEAASRASVLQAFRAAGVVKLGGFELDLSNRTRPGSTFTDIVFIGADGRIVH
jgi:ABC-type branched-subunit amino acid transport system substrate-binding protein